MRLHFGNYLQQCMWMLDLVTLNLVFFISFVIVHYDTGYVLNNETVYVFISINFLWLVCSSYFKIYDSRYINSFESFSKRSFKAGFYFLSLSSIIIFLFDKGSFYFGISALIAFGLMLFINRFIYLVLYQYLKNKNILEKRILIIGYNEVSKKLVQYLEGESLDNRIVGFSANFDSVNELTSYPVLSSVDDAVKASREFDVNEIFSTISPEQNESIYSLMQQADQECIRFKLIPDLSIFINRPYHLEFHDGFPIVSLRNEPMEMVSNRIKKRLFDIVFSFLVTVFILSWLIPLMSIIILIDSKGPIFFIQERSGKNNRTFRCYKFRSMRVTEDANIRQATRNDERLTKVGRFLRKTNLDEFPQFINVLKGEMSIVGPRPHMLKHTEEYSRILNQYMIRQFLKPGITGWAQVSGFRGETKTVFQMQKRVEHDIYYMENWSLLFDVRIMFLTVYNIIVGEKNAF